MKFVISTLIFLCAAFASGAESTTSDFSSVVPNIKKGHMQIGGGFSFSKDNSGDDDIYTQIYPRAEYFVMDNFSAGGTIMYVSSGSATLQAIGPSVSYFFYEYKNIAAHLGQTIGISKSSEDSKSYTRGATSLGINFFAVPQVAFGAALSTNYAIGEKQDFNVDTTTLIGSFSFFY